MIKEQSYSSAQKRPACNLKVVWPTLSSPLSSSVKNVEVIGVTITSTEEKMSALVIAVVVVLQRAFLPVKIASAIIIKAI